ncbi:FemAB family XrtA/PEP-CTERM system-associated protein [Paraglaciecola sp. 2405UD69-4]|uniref:FemAB family XrtA/PEP-CTERM system-associated protein n=1 Tax=Paraglaciecola sp. 2405UD69-4 TaxID=3391836 RepID=UPI0039C9AC3D
MNIRLSVTSDKQAWEQYVNAHPDATPYHRFAWVQSIEQAYHHKNVSFIALEGGSVVGVLPCINMKKPFSSSVFCSLPYCDLGFCLADNETIQKAIITKATEHLKSVKGSAFEYRDSNLTATDELSFEGEKVRMLLPLPESSDELMSSFKSKLRSQIRKSEKNGLTFNIASNSKSIDDFYQIFSINMRKLGSPVHSKEWFKTLFDNYGDNIILSVVYSENIPVGAGIVLVNGKKACIPWASTVSEYNRLAPNMMLYWSLLQHVSNTNVEEFDFGRSTFNEGTYKFKRQWGAKPQPLKWSNLIADNQEKSESNIKVSKVRELVENVWSKLPLKVTTVIGPMIRRHISL